MSNEEILESKDLHNYYYPNGDSSKPKIHDKDCHFCDYENLVKEAMDDARNDERTKAIKELVEWMERKINEGRYNLPAAAATMLCITHAKSLLNQQGEETKIK